MKQNGSGTKRAGRPLPASFFRRPSEVVARELIGAMLLTRRGGALTAGRIVETEAYLGADDPASHGYRLRRHARNESLYAPPGTWYVYLSYGIHWCANLTARGAAPGCAVLLRAVAPLEGLGVMRRRRGGVRDRLLADGPGKLCQALGIDVTLDGTPMAGSWAVVLPGVPADRIAVTPRIGITKAVDWPLRFLDAGETKTARRS